MAKPSRKKKTTKKSAAAKSASSPARSKTAKKPTKKSPTKKTAAKKTPAKKASSKKAPVKKTAAKKTASKKTASKKTASKKTASKTTAKKPIAKKAPRATGGVKKKPAAKKRTAKKIAAKKQSVKKAVTKKAPAKKPAGSTASAKKTTTKSSSSSSKKKPAPKQTQSTDSSSKPTAKDAKKSGRKGITIVSDRKKRSRTKAPRKPFITPGGSLLGPGVVRKPLIPSGPQAESPAKTEAADPSKPKKSPFNKRELTKFKNLLLIKRAEVFGDIEQMEADALRSSSGDLSHLPQHLADQGSDSYEQSLSLDLAAADRRLIKEIDDALARVDSRTYGVCERTGKPIRKTRLQELPWARYSIEAARELERRGGF